MKESCLDKKLTTNFTLKEFVISRFYGESQERVIESFKHDAEAQENIEHLAQELQALRDYLNVPVSINIAYRPKWWEIARGRSGKSRHVLGKAADITAQGKTPIEIAQAIQHLNKEGKMKAGGIGLYSTFVHYDIDRSRRWGITF